MTIENIRQGEKQSPLKWLDFLPSMGGYIGGLMLVGMAILVVMEVVRRYIFNSPTNWNMPSVVYLFIALAFSSAAYVYNKNRHINIDLILVHLGPRVRALWEIVITLLFFIFAVAMTYLTAREAFSSFSGHERAFIGSSLPVWPVKMFMPLGGLFLVLALVKDLILKTGSVLKNLPEKGKGVFSEPAIILPVFIAAIGISLYLTTVNGIWGGMILLFVLLMLGIHIFPAMGLVGISGLYLLFGGFPVLNTAVPVTAFSALDNYALTTIPFSCWPAPCWIKAG